MKLKRPGFFAAATALLFSCGSFAAEKPNILIIWGDDVGQFGKNHLGDRDEIYGNCGHGRQTVLRLVEQHPHARLNASQTRIQG